MKVVYVEPGKQAVIAEIGEELEDLQAAVGGGLIQAIYPFTDAVAVVCNDEGKLLGMEFNRPMMNEDGEIYDAICGPFFVCGLTEDNFGSLTDELADKYLLYYKNPWQFLPTPQGIAVFEDVWGLDIEQ